MASNTSNNLNASNDPSKFQEWVNTRNKNRIDKAKNRHPVMTQMRKFADDKIVERFKSSPSFPKENIKYISVFEAEEFKPSFIDNFFFAYEKFSKIFLVKFNLFKAKSIKALDYTKSINSILIDKVDSLYERSSSQITGSVEKKAQISIKESFFIKKVCQLIDRFTAKTSDPIEAKLLEREKLQKQLENKMTINKILNFWRNVLLVKPNYVAEIKQRVKKVQKTNYGTLFYKFIKIVQSKTNLKFSISKRKVLSLPLILSFLYLVKYRYNLYDKQIISEFEEIDSITDLVINSPTKVKKIATIYDEQTDKEYLNILKREKDLIKTSFEKVSEEAEKKDDPFLKEYVLLINSVGMREALYLALKVAGTAGFALYSYLYLYRKKKIATKNKIVVNSLLLYLIMNEFFLSFSYADFLQQKNFAAIYEFNNDFNLLHKYNFFRSNIHNAYVKL